MQILNILIAVFLTLSLSSGEDNDDDVTVYDYFVLALTWPEGYCDSIGDGCNRTKLTNSWTIHGLWPTTYSQVSRPAFCSGGAYDPSAMSSALRDELTEAWPNYRAGTTDESFWSYEWSKHGTCALTGDVDTFPTQTSYFRQTLQLYGKYDFREILRASDIDPGAITSLSELKSSFKRHFGVKSTATFQCLTQANNQILTGSHFCLSANFTVISCPSGKTDSCSYSSPVLYLSSAGKYPVLSLQLLVAVLFVFIL